MKIQDVVFLQGGLGNQMFQYAFYLSLLEHKPNAVCDKTLLERNIQHNGYELQNLFSIQVPSSFCLNRILRILLLASHFPFLLTLLSKVFGIRLASDYIASASAANYFTLDKKCFYFGYWQSEKYFKNLQLSQVYKFKEELISTSTREMKNRIQLTNSISIHIRRGDYLTPENYKLYGGICDLSYYQKAISFMKQHTQDPVFYVFSNDVDWVKSNFKSESFVFVDINSGKDSWQDMYLMSLCKHNIIANSTFSWWGAWLNSNPDKLVVSPSKFQNIEVKSEIVPDSWHKI